MRNKEKIDLEDYNVTQLTLLLKQLRLGSTHLKNLLTKNQLKEFLDWCALSEQQKELMSSNTLEKLGNMSLIINTILTSTLGAWMGLSGCLECRIDSYQSVIFISIFALFVSGLFGFMSASSTNKQAQEAIINQRIVNSKLRVLKIINKKNNEKCHSLAQYLNIAISVLENNKNELIQDRDNFFKDMHEAYNWFGNFSHVLNSQLKEMENDPVAFRIFQKHVIESSYQIKKILGIHVNFLEKLNLDVEQKKKSLQLKPSLPFLKILTNPIYAIPRNHSNLASYGFKNNFLQLFIGLAPTIWGSFASMFVFIEGIPAIARELHFTNLALLLTQPFSRAIEISIALSVTCYMAFSFFYSFHKRSQRQQLLDKTEIEIAKEEMELLENTHKLSILYRIKAQTHRVVAAFHVVKQIEFEKEKESMALQHSNN